MNVQRLGFWALVAVLLVDFGQLHRMVPGLAALKPGLITQLVLFLLVLLELPTLRWFRSIAVWRFLFLCAIGTGLLAGVTEGRVLLIFKTEVPRYLTAFLGVCLFVRRVRDLRTLHNLFIAMALLIALWVITHGGKGPGLFRDENDAALVLVMFLPFAFLRIFFEGSARLKAASLAVFFIALLGIGLTLSRGGMVGAIPALVFCWLKSRNKLIGVGLGAAALAGAVAVAPDALLEEFRSIGDTQGGTAGARRYLWDLSVQMFMERPVFGVGAFCWGNALYSGLIEEPLHRAHMTPHSIYFQMLTELGLAGTFAWMGLLSATALGLRALRGDRLNAEAGLVLAADPEPRTLVRLRADMLFMRSFVPALAIGIVGYLVCGAFLSVLYYPGLPLFAALVQASREAWRNELVLAAAASDAARGNAAAADGRGRGTADAARRTPMEGGRRPGGAFRP
jgi:hypothetical protein